MICSTWQKMRKSYETHLFTRCTSIPSWTGTWETETIWSLFPYCAIMAYGPVSEWDNGSRNYFYQGKWTGRYDFLCCQRKSKSHRLPDFRHCLWFYEAHESHCAWWYGGDPGTGYLPDHPADRDRVYRYQASKSAVWEMDLFRYGSFSPGGKAYLCFPVGGRAAEPSVPVFGRGWQISCTFLRMVRKI